MGTQMHQVLVWLALWFLCALAKTDPSSPHSLSYHYAGTYDAGGLRDFWAAGLLDGAPVDGYDRTTRTKVPTQPWMRDGLNPEYWHEGSISRAAKEDWFRRNVEILKKRTNHTQGQHTLQWAMGCELEPGGVVRGWYQFAYDGADFLLFDPGNLRWLAAVTEAEATQRRWDAQPTFGHQLEHYLRDTCLEWLGQFLRSRRAWAQRAAAPQLQIWARPMPERPGWLTLKCLARGFPTRDIMVIWLRGNATLPSKETRNGLPSGDGTYQRLIHLQVPEGEAHGVQCRASHGDLETPLETEWSSHAVPSPPSPGSTGMPPGAAVALGVLGGLVVLAGVLLLWRKRARWQMGQSRLDLVLDEEVAEDS